LRQGSKEPDDLEAQPRSNGYLHGGELGRRQSSQFPYPLGSRNRD